MSGAEASHNPMVFRSPLLARMGALFVSCLAVCPCPGQAVEGVPQPANPYKLAPFHADFPVELAYPPMVGREYVRTRRQALERLASNLQGGVRREAWLIATDFFQRAPEDAVDPLVEAMDRAFGKPGLDDVVKNCVDAMGAMRNEGFDGALRRALQHPNPIVRQAAFCSIASSGSVDTVRELAGAFDRLDGRARSAWLRAARERLPREEALRALMAVVMGEYPTQVRDLAVKEAMQLPAEEAARVLGGRWEQAVGEFKAIIAGVFHAADDTRGTTWLLASFDGEDFERLQLAVRHGARGELGPLRDKMLALATHPRQDVRLELAKALVRVDGDDVASCYEILVTAEDGWEARAIGLRELTRRGRGKAVDVLLEEAPLASGTRLQQVLNDLTASGDPRAVPVLLERFQKAPEGESRPFLQALAANQSAAAATSLLAIFQGPEKVVGRGGAQTLTTRNYLPTLLLNLRGAERTVIAGFLALPKEDWRLRAALLPTLAGFAADRLDPVLQQECIAPLRAILFDRAELPQLRVCALNQMARRWLTVEDAMRLKNGLFDEPAGLRALFADFLTDAF